MTRIIVESSNYNKFKELAQKVHVMLNGEESINYTPPANGDRHIAEMIIPDEG